MVNRKGIFRIIEAVFAVLIIAGVLLTVVVKNTPHSQKEINSELNVLLDEVAKNTSLRDSILVEGLTQANENRLEEFIFERISRQDYNYTLRLCAPDEVCGLETYPDNARDVYASERILSASIGQADFASKKLKIFVWRVGL